MSSLIKHGCRHLKGKWCWLVGGIYPQFPIPNQWKEDGTVLSLKPRSWSTIWNDSAKDLLRQKVLYWDFVDLAQCKQHRHHLHLNTRSFCKGRKKENTGLFPLRILPTSNVGIYKSLKRGCYIQNDDAAASFQLCIIPTKGICNFYSIPVFLLLQIRFTR